MMTACTATYWATCGMLACFTNVWYSLFCQVESPGALWIELNTNIFLLDCEKL